MQLTNIFRLAFSKHNTLPRKSIVFAVIFLAGFIGLSIFSFTQNSKRLGLIETINQENLPSVISEIQDDVIQLGHVINADDLLSPEQHENLVLLLEEIKTDLLDLQNKQLAVVSTPDVTKHFVGIYGALDGIDNYLEKGHTTLRLRANLNGYLQNISSHFYQIDVFAQDYHQKKVTEVLNILRKNELTLLGIDTGFVILGTIMIVFLLVDLFRRGELLERAGQAERLKNSFFAMMSHEIRTPINGILGTISLLQDTHLNKEQMHLTEVVHTSAESLLVIVNDVLDYSKIEAGKLELEYSDFDLKKMLDSTFDLVRPLAEAKHLQCNYILPENIDGRLNSDPARVRQILLNFLSNSIKFTDKGSVKLNIKTEHLLNNGDYKTYIRFEVTDTGMGISEESKQRLFREFSQVDGSYARRFAGTGLGLAICRRLVEMMHGTIGVESEVGKGSTFWFSVPLIAAKEAVVEKETERTTTQSIGPARLLLVEDNPTNRMIALAFLKQGGHHIDEAHNGLEALEAITKNTYDAVLMDIAMPKMDGFAATRAIRAMGGAYKTLPIIAMTAHAMRGDREECISVGMDDYITKPLSKEALLQMVGKWTGTKNSAVEKCELTNELASPVAEQEISEMHLKQIITDLGMENISSFSKIFFDDLKETGAAMLNAEKTGEWEVLKTHAHSLKSSTLSFGLIRLSRFASKIEAECKNKGQPDPSLLKEWLSRVETALAALNAKFVELKIEL